MKRKSQPAAPDRAVVIELRKQVRVVLSALPSARPRIARVVIKAKLESLGFTFTDAELDEAIEWNHSHNFIDYRHNHDLEADEWHLTEKGAARE